MQKGANRILGALIVLVMALSILSAAVFATGETAKVLEGWSITLSDDIGVKFHLDSEGYTVTATVNGTEVTPTVSGKVVTVNVSAAQMTAPIVLTVKNGTETVYNGEYSVREYAETVLEGSYDVYVKDMVKKMLNYGAAAQTYFDYNTTNLANAGYELEPAGDIPTDAPAPTVRDNLGGIELYGMSLVLRNKLAVRFYFTLDEGVDINSFTFSQGTLGTKSGMHYVEVDGINPQDVANQIELTVTSTAGSGSVAISYSPLNYIVRMSANSSSDSLKGLVQALYGYHEEAKYYDSVVPVGSLQANVNGHGAYNNGIYFSTQETNDAPYGDWNTYYDTANEDCLKLVRNGQIISVGLTGRNTICKFGANDYALRLENHTIGEYAPYTTDDMFIVEGAYTHANSGTTLYIAKTYIYYDGAKWVFSDTEPVYEPETESPFTFDKGVFSADIFNNRNNGPTVSVENKQLKLQLPAGAPNWLWIKQDMKAGTVITMDVTFSGEGMNIYGYGSKANGDPITSGAVTEPAAWYSGQGGNANGSYTFTIYEDCYGLSLMLGFAGSTETAIYIDNVKIVLPPETESPFTFDGGSYSADIFNNRNNGPTVSVENKQLKLQLPAGAPNWLWLKQDMKAGTVVTMDVTFSGEGMSIHGYGSKENGDPITEGTVTESVPQGWFWGQGGSESGSYTFTIYEDCHGLSLMLGFAGSTETAIYIDNVVITAPEVVEPTVVSGGNMTEHGDGWDAAGDIFFALAENEIPVDENAETEYAAESGVIKFVRDGNTTELTGTVVKYGATDYYMVLSGDALPLQNKDYLIVEGNFANANNNYTLNISKTYILVDGENLVYSTTEPDLSTSYDVGVLQANVNGHGAYNNGIYFSTQETNDAPYGENGAWDTYYDSASVDCLKLVRGGETISVGLTGKNTICKFSANDYALRLENWTIGDYAPFTTDDMFIVEGAYTHANSKTTLNIAKTYIYYDGSNWVFSDTEPVFEPETESPFTFDKGVFSADIFNNRNGGLSVSVENKQLKLQQPAGASNWLWLKQEMKAGTVITMDVTFSDEGMNIYGYGSNQNGDPITSGAVTEPAAWYNGQGGSTNGSYTFTIYEDCYGLSLMLGFAGSTETAIYIDNVKIVLPPETESPFTFDGGSYSADIFNNRNGGLSVSVENKQLKLQQPAGASNWLWLKQDMKAGTVITMDVTFSGEGMNIYGYGSNQNGDPITSGAVTEPAAWYNGQGGSTNGSYTFTIYEDCYGLSLMLGFAGSTETAIYIDNVVIKLPAETKSPFTFDGGSYSADIFNNRNNGPTVSVENKQLKLQLPAGAPNWLWIKQDMKAGTVVTMDVTFSGEGMNIYGYGSKANGDPITSGAVTEPAAWYSGQGGNANGSYTFTIYEDCYGLSLMLGFAGSTETAIYIDNVVITAPAPSTSYDVGVLQANVNGHGAYNNGIYFSTQETNDAPYGDWNTYYDTANEDCLKLIRNGQIISVGLTGRNTICKFSANDYALRLENHTIGEYAPFTTDDIFIVEGAFTHVNSKTTLNIAKTYIYYDGSNWVFSATEPVFEPETESPFTFDKGVFSADIFNNRNNGLSVSVENKQLKLQQPAGASNWLWLRQNMKAGTVVTMDVTLSGEGMNIFAYGANGNGDPITEGTVTDSVPQSWFWGQGGSESGSYTFTIYEDCYGLALMLGFAGSTETAIYIDNVVIKLPAETQSPFTFDGGSYSADIFNNRNGGLSVSVENKQLKLQQPAGASNWLWLNKELKAGTVITMDVTFSAEGMNIFGYGAKANGDPITEGTVTESVPQGWFWGQGGSTNGSYTFTIYEDCYGLSLMLGFAGSTETAIYIDNVVITEPIETDFGTVILPTSTDTLNIGVWNGSQHAFANEQLKQLQAAGITKITGVNTAHIGTDNVSAWLDRVYSYGIRVIIDLRGWDGATVPSYANHPGLIGFLMYDEPNANVFDDLAALKAKFDAVMPADKLFYVNLFPECAADSSLGETNWWDQLVGNNLDYDEDYVTEFLNKLDIEVLSWDNYSLLEGSGIRTEYFHNFEVMAGKKLPLWYTMLSAGHNATYATPTADELRWQMAVAMTYGVQNIDHYVYSSHEDGYSCMFDLNTQNVTDLYYDIKDVDNEYLAWDNIYMAYKWQGVGAYDAGTSNAMLTMLENKLNLTNYGLTVTSSNEDLLVGVFDHNGNKAYMITNAGSAGSSKVGDGKSFTTADATVTVKLAEGSYKCAAVIDNGEISFVAVNADNTVTLSVEAYEGVFIIPVLN